MSVYSDFADKLKTLLENVVIEQGTEALNAMTNVELIEALCAAGVE